MEWVALTCPQCSAPLPRVALWRAVKCASCGSLINRTESIVRRDAFRQALARSRHEAGGREAIICGGATYILVEPLGVGDISKVHLALRVSASPLLATMKVSSDRSAATRYAREAQVLRELQTLEGDGAGAYYGRLLPEAIAQGPIEGSDSQQGLALTHAAGFWGSLAALSDRSPMGLDPRHAVWIWRRMLEVLGFIHNHGWTHGDIRPEHALVHPQNHAVRLIGWAAAQNDSDPKARAMDLCRSARIIQVLLSGSNDSNSPGSVPAGLAELIAKAAEEEKFSRDHGPAGLDNLLKAEARKAFGPPAFVPLTI